MIDNWIAHGQPRPDGRFDSFNEWYATIGGILAAAGFDLEPASAATEVAPIDSAKANLLLYVFDHAVAVEDGDARFFTPTDIHDLMADPEHTENLTEIIEGLLYHTRGEEEAAFIKLLDGIRNRKVAHAIVARAMRAAISPLATKRNADGRAVTVRRLSKGSTQRAGYRMLDTDANLDRRGGRT